MGKAQKMALNTENTNCIRTNGLTNIASRVRSKTRKVDVRYVRRHLKRIIKQKKGISDDEKRTKIVWGCLTDRETKNLDGDRGINRSRDILWEVENTLD